MSEPEITVNKIAYRLPVNVLGTDDEGRTLVQCPSRGCGEAATVMDDGRIVCPVGEAEAEALERLMRPLLEMESRPEWSGGQQ